MSENVLCSTFKKVLRRVFYLQLLCCTLVFLAVRSYLVEVCSKQQNATVLLQREVSSAEKKILQWDSGVQKWSVKLQPVLFVRRLMQKSGAEIRSGIVRKVSAQKWIVNADLSVSVQDAGRLFRNLNRIPYGVVIWRFADLRVHDDMLRANLQLEWIVEIT